MESYDALIRWKDQYYDVVSKEIKEWKVTMYELLNVSSS